MRAAWLALLVPSSLVGCATHSARSQLSPAARPITGQDIQQEFQSDRPGVADSRHVAPVGPAQLVCARSSDAAERQARASQ
jgi:hypothetical protein